MMNSSTPLVRFADDIEKYYGIVPTAIYAAPRGFAAETYYVDAACGSFFLKIMNTPRRQEIFKNGLKVVDALVGLGIDYIPKVIQLTNGELYFHKGNAVAALFARIHAAQSYAYNREDVFRKLAHIYRTSLQIPHPELFMKETFSDRFIGTFEKELRKFMESEAEGAEAIEVKAIIEPYADFLKACSVEARKIVSECRVQSAEFYLTHSDFPGNVMIAESGEQYLIDFDEAIFGPMERDGFLCIAADNEESKLWLSVMKEIFPDYQVNNLFIRYYLYERFMVDLATFLQEVVHHPEIEHRRKVTASTRDYLFGWLYPMIVKIS